MDAGEPATLRELMEIRPAGPELSLDQVEKPETLCHRFIASAMSLGSLSPEAHQTITAGMNMLGRAVEHGGRWRRPGSVPAAGRPANNRGSGCE